MQWIIENKEWLFSGLGLSILSLIFLSLRKNKRDGNIPSNSQVIGAIEAGRDVKINQTINPDNTIPDQIQVTLMSLKQMPGRLQESVNLGVTSFSFEEARSELEKLYALAKASEYQDLVTSIETFQGNYNRYIELINLAIEGEATLEEVNNYHQQNVILAFENGVQLLNNQS